MSTDMCVKCQQTQSTGTVSSYKVEMFTVCTYKVHQSRTNMLVLYWFWPQIAVPVSNRYDGEPS